MATSNPTPIYTTLTDAAETDLAVDPDTGEIHDT
jgi:hypothetical protein